MKDKNPPIKKNGAKGMYFCLCLCAHIAPVIHAIINASDRPLVPSHKPPTPINFMSPMPIGVVFSPLCFCRCLSYIAPIVKVKMYPNVAAITASDKSIGKNGKKVISNIPISISGNR